MDLADLGGTAPPRISQVLEIVNNLPLSMVFLRKSTNSEPTHPQPPYGALTHWTTVRLPKSPPRARYQTTRDSLVPQSPLKLLNWPILNLLTLPCWLLLVEITMKALAHSSLILLCLLTSPDARCAVPPFFGGSVSHKLSFQWQSF